MKLRYIHYFQVLAEELNFSRAAKRLHIAQPPLSRQIQELEEWIGAKLFHRTKRQVELTNAGKVFLEMSYEIIELVEDASSKARLSSTGTHGDFRIGFTGTVQDLIPFLQTYREKFPQVGIILKQMNNVDQIVALHQNSIDIAIVSAPIDHENVKTIPIKKMHFVAALPENHLLADKPTLFLRDLADETFIMTPKSAGSLYYETMMELFKTAKFAPKVTIQAHDLQTVLVLVSADMGIALTPSPIYGLNGVVHRKIEDFNLSIVGLLAWRIDNKSEILDNFLTFFFDYYKDIIENGDS